MNTLDIKEITNTVQKELAIKNPMAAPKLTKIVINMGLGAALSDSKLIDRMNAQLIQIAGQKPQVTRAKQSIATFKLRAGDKVGLKVTLRGKRMYDFLQKLTNVVLPRLRDFRGISSRAFDRQGNYSLGLSDLSVFPEVDFAQLDQSAGIEMTFVTNCADSKAARLLLEKLGMPFEKSEEDRRKV